MRPIFYMFVWVFSAVLCVAAEEKTLSESEAVALSVTELLNSGKTDEAVKLFHPDALEGAKRMTVQIAETARSPMDAKMIFDKAGVSSLQELKAANAGVVAAVALAMAEKYKPP